MPLLSCLHLLILATAAPSAQDSSSVAQIEAALHRFPSTFAGERDEDAMDRVLAVLYRHPDIATRVLVARLKPTPRGNHNRTPPVVWYIRALRSLTGLEFAGLTRAVLSDDERGWLGADSAQRVHFFGWHMAWDQTWVAPEDAQIAIIGKWRAWFKGAGKTFKYANDRREADWLY
jgi:hypothetical protein